MTTLEADPCIFMPTSVQNLEIVSFAVPLLPPPPPPQPPLILNYKSTKSPEVTWVWQRTLNKV